MHAWFLRIGSLFAALSLLAFATGSALADQDLKVDLGDFSFTPKTPTVRAGEKINFTLVNVGRFPHNLTIQGPGGATANVAAANIAAGQTGTGSYTFSAPGTYTFWCPVGMHRANGMEGTFQVTAVGAAASAGTLPRTGGLPVEMVGGGLAALAGLSFVSGFVLRRRS
jgi:plastocyanin